MTLVSIPTKCHLALPGREGSKTWTDRVVPLCQTSVFCCYFIDSTLVRSQSVVFVSSLTGQRWDILRIPPYLTISHQIGYRFHEITEAERTPDTCDESLWSPASEYALAQVRSSLSSSGFVKTITDLMEYHEVWRFSRNISSLACKPWERNDRLASYQRRIDKRTAKYCGVTERNNSVSPRFLTPPGREVPNGTIDIFSNL